jgi:FKBP-type peptidyl-prolyl cis-trans isomerase 2
MDVGDYVNLINVDDTGRAAGILFSMSNEHVESDFEQEPGGRTINVTIKVTDELSKELEDIAKREARSVSQTGYLLLQRALGLYRHDGQLFVRS